MKATVISNMRKIVNDKALNLKANLVIVLCLVMKCIKSIKLLLAEEVDTFVECASGKFFGSVSLKPNWFVFN